MCLAWKIIWKTPVVVVATIIGALGASQVGWSGAELVLNTPIMGLLEIFVTTFIAAIAGIITIVPVLLVHKMAKPALWVIVPILLYFLIVPGVWNGFISDFDGTRAAVLTYGYANAYALEHMTARGRYRTCEDERIELTDDGKAICERSIKAAPGEPIPGSEHRCGFLGRFMCFDATPKDDPSRPTPDQRGVVQG